MPLWMKRRIEHARERCQKTLLAHKQQTERKDAEKQQHKKSKTHTRSR